MMNQNQINDIALAVYELKMVRSFINNYSDDMDVETATFGARKISEIIAKLEEQITLEIKL